MTPDIDLEKVRDWLERGTRWLSDKSSPDTAHLDQRAAYLLAVNGVPALLSALTATRAELDERQADLDRARNERKWAEEDRDSAKRYVDKLCARRDDVLSQRDAARAEADTLRAELETARAVALSNKRAHTTAFAECERLSAELVGVRSKLAKVRAENITLRAKLAEVRRLCDNTIWILNANDVRAVLAAAPQPDETYDPIAVLDEAIAASGVRITFDPRRNTAPHTHRGPKATDHDREHPAHDGQTCEEYEAAGAGDGEQDTTTRCVYAFSPNGDDQLLLWCETCSLPGMPSIVAVFDAGDTWHPMEYIAQHEKPTASGQGTAGEEGTA